MSDGSASTSLLERDGAQGGAQAPSRVLTVLGRVKRHRLTVPALPAALAAAILAVGGLSGPSYWLDEAATLEMSRRSLSDMWATFQVYDSAHAVYEFFMHFVIKFLGGGETATRLPSAVAAVLTAAMVAVLGRRIAGPRVGLIAGLFFAIHITVGKYALEAREYTIMMLLATIATYLLVRALETGSWRWFAPYGLIVAFMILTHIDSAFILPAHGVTVLWFKVLKDPRGRVVPFGVVALGAVLVNIPSVRLTVSQKAVMIGWIEPLDEHALYILRDSLAGTGWLVIPVLALVGIGITLKPRIDDGDSTVTAYALPWLFVPIALILAYSLKDPIYQFRYIAYIVPALTLLVAIGLVKLSKLWQPVTGAVLVLALVLTLPEQVAIRQQDSKLADLRGLAVMLDQQTRPGDMVIYLDSFARWEVAAYPWAYRNLRDITLDKIANTRGLIGGENLVGSNVYDPAVLIQRLRQGRRVWVIARDEQNDLPVDRQVRLKAMADAGLTEQKGEWRFKFLNVRLLVRPLPMAPPPAPLAPEGKKPKKAKRP